MERIRAEPDDTPISLKAEFDQLQLLLDVLKDVREQADWDVYGVALGTLKTVIADTEQSLALAVYRVLIQANTEASQRLRTVVEREANTTLRMLRGEFTAVQRSRREGLRVVGVDSAVLLRNLQTCLEHLDTLMDAMS